MVFFIITKFFSKQYSTQNAVDTYYNYCTGIRHDAVLLISGGYIMTTIYIDVLLVLNIYVNFFLLRATAGFTHTPLKNMRCIASSVIGSFFSLTILLPSDSFLLSLVIKLLASAVIVAISFGIKDRRAFLKLMGFFYIINFIFAGVVGFMYIMLNPSFMAFNNSYFYIDFSLISLVVFTAIAYFAVTIVRRILDRSLQTTGKYTVTIKYENRIFTLEAIADTGNTLEDSFTGKPVIICPQKVSGIETDFTDCNAEYVYKEYGFRIIPYSTIDNAGFIPVFSPDEIMITHEESGKKFRVEALLGIIQKETPAIFNPKLLI